MGKWERRGEHMHARHRAPGTRKYFVTPQHTKPSPLTPRAGTEALSAPRGRTTPPRRRSNALSRWTESTNLMREAIRGHQAQSGVTHSRCGTEGVTNLMREAIKGHQRSSGAIRSNEPGEGGHQRSSGAIRSNEPGGDEAAGERHGAWLKHHRNVPRRRQADHARRE